MTRPTKVAHFYTSCILPSANPLSFLCPFPCYREQSCPPRQLFVAFCGGHERVNRRRDGWEEYQSCSIKEATPKKISTRVTRRREARGNVAGSGSGRVQTSAPLFCASLHRHDAPTTQKQKQLPCMQPSFLVSHCCMNAGSRRENRGLRPCG